VIAEPCIDTKDTACVEVCPVDCIHPKKDGAEFADVNKLYIDPETCIDCCRFREFWHWSSGNSGTVADPLN